jgi:hypothetical protein
MELVKKFQHMVAPKKSESTVIPLHSIDSEPEIFRVARLSVSNLVPKRGFLVQKMYGVIPFWERTLSCAWWQQEAKGSGAEN